MHEICNHPCSECAAGCNCDCSPCILADRNRLQVAFLEMEGANILNRNALRLALKREKELKSALRSTRLEVDHHKAVVRELVSGGRYNANLMEEGLDGQVLRELKALTP